MNTLETFLSIFKKRNIKLSPNKLIEKFQRLYVEDGCHFFILEPDFIEEYMFRSEYGYGRWEEDEYMESLNSYRRTYRKDI